MLELRQTGLTLKPDNILVKPFSVCIAPGEVVTLMGASGSGKSSLLSFIGGDLADAFVGEGDVLLCGRSVTNLAPEQRHIGRLFQDDLLFPHMTVAENLLFAIPRLAKAERIAMMKTALERAELQGFEHRPPHTLSGGQRSRVALMRALLAKPAAILLDEPFSKLDRPLRAAVRAHTFAHIKARAIPALLVTHDPEDIFPGARVLRLAPDGAVSHV